MTAKCGEVRVWHWAHQGSRLCDAWWEGETLWHRSWKDQFPVEWQEIVHYPKDGERHIADVKTENDWVIEFQHSFLNQHERRSRDQFYQKLIWVVDGTRRKRDIEQFSVAWRDGISISGYSSLRKTFSDGCRLLREWADSPSPVFLDFGQQEVLWWILARDVNSSAYVAPYSRAKLIDSHRRQGPEVAAKEFDAFVSEIPQLVATHESWSGVPRTRGTLRL